MKQNVDTPQGGHADAEETKAHRRPINLRARLQASSWDLTPKEAQAPLPPPQNPPRRIALCNLRRFLSEPGTVFSQRSHPWLGFRLGPA